MSKKHPTVDVKIDGRIYTLKFGINECCDLEDALGLGITEIADRLGVEGRFSIKMVRTLFRIGLSENALMSDIEAGELLSKTNINDVMTKVGEAFALAFPAVGEAETREKAAV